MQLIFGFNEAFLWSVRLARQKPLKKSSDSTGINQRLAHQIGSIAAGAVAACGGALEDARSAKAAGLVRDLYYLINSAAATLTELSGGKARQSARKARVRHHSA